MDRDAYPITGNRFLQWLFQHGIIPETTHHVVIDARVGNAVLIYAELYGSERLIKVDPPSGLQGARITILDRNPEKDEECSPAN